MLKGISIFAGILILGIGEIIFAKIVLNEKIKVSNFKLIILLLFITLLYTFSSIYLTGIIKTFINCILHIFEFKYIFKIDYMKSFLLTIIYIILLVMVEIIEFLLLIKIFDFSHLFLYNTFANSIISNVTACILFSTSGYLLRKYLNKIVNYKMENKKRIIIFSFLTFLCILIIFYNAFRNIEFNTNLIISIFTMIIFAIILISLMKQMYENNNLTKKYEQVLEFMITYEDEVEKQRVLRHETKNAFLTIKAQITDKSKEKEIIDYIDSILKDDTKMKFEEYVKFKYLPANGIKGLCYYKVQEAMNKEIKVCINVSSRIEKSVISKLSVDERKELGKILGVFLDNAIEASSTSKEKQLGFEAYLIDNNVKIIISNSYDNKIDTNKIGKDKYTTKGKNRGHGLLLVKNIVNNNENRFETKTEITDKLYIQNIIIKKSTDKK